MNTPSNLPLGTADQMSQETRLPYVSPGEFGLTNSDTLLRAVRQYSAEAVADGWSIRPTYSTEPIERAASLERDGFKMMVLARDNRDVQGRNFKFEAQISLWGPDRLAIPVPRFYDFPEIQRRVRHCSNCKRNDVDTQRYSFAGRCCAECLPAMVAKHEQPGWNR